MEREAKENVYAVLDPHIQYELTINNHGEPPKYLSLSKPLTHQRTHAFDPQTFKFNEINNNFYNESGITKLRSDHNRKSDRNKRRNNEHGHCKSNNDIKYSIDPNFGMVRDTNNMTDAQNRNRCSFYNKNRMSGRSSGRKQDVTKTSKKDILAKTNSNRGSSKSVKVKDFDVHTVRGNETERSFEDMKVNNKLQSKNDDTMPRPGKVKEIASKFNNNSVNGKLSHTKVRPKPIQSYDQAYINHIFPDAVEI